MNEEIIPKEETTHRDHSKSHSVFAPIILIAAGVFFLLENLNILPPLNWSLALRFWPLLLIFIGLNVLVVQIRRPWGTLLSLLLALSAVGVFSYLLLGSNPSAVTDRLGIVAPASALNEEAFAVSGEGVESAEIRVELGNYQTGIHPLSEGTDLIAGTIMSRGELQVQTDQKASGLTTVHVREKSGSGWILNPTGWNNEGARWEFFLNPAIPIDLRVDGGNGATESDFSELILSHLSVNGGNGAFGTALPGGNYDIEINGGNGRINVNLPPSGRQEMEIDGGNGSIHLRLPPEMEARLEFDEDVGNIAVSERFSLIEGDEEEGIYQTSGYETAANRILIDLETGNGQASIGEP